jgi:hypothetical protein
MFKPKSRASATTEYAFILGTVFLSLIGMNIYLKRGIQARVKDLTTHLIVKDLYEELAPEGRSHQFVAGNSQSSADITTTSSQTQRTTNQQTTDNFIQGITRSANETSVAEGWEDLLPTPTP